MNNTIERFQIISYDKFYDTCIRPKIEALDSFIRSTSSSYKLYDVACILEIEIEEVHHLMNQLSISSITNETIFSLILSASSPICQLIAKQHHYNSYTELTPEIISDIYSLSLHKVSLAFQDLNVAKIPPSELTSVFKRIHLSII